MRTIARVLCPIDFSEFARHALDQAVALARWQGATTTVLHVVPPRVSSLPFPLAPPYRAIAYTPEDLERSTVETAAFVEQACAGTRVETMVVDGTVADEIVRVARSLPADVLVMGTHGRTGLERLMLGSVTERVLRTAPCPVLAVPRRASGARSRGPAPFARILCAVDFSPSSLTALGYADALARRAGARLIAVHVVEPVPVFEPVLMGGPGTPEYDDRAVAIAEQRLRQAADAADAAEEHGRTRAAAVTPVVASGRASREIVRIAAGERCDLIVIGAHRRGPGPIDIGSTTNHVLRQAACPVLFMATEAGGRHARR
jgi:nucleotide-binding universal stress UspA family protein